MKWVNFLLILSALVALMTSTAYAVSPFAMTAANTGTNEWTYTLFNNDSQAKAYMWTLHWNPTDSIDDAAKAESNFDRYQGFPSPWPLGWSSVMNGFPGMSVVNLNLAVGPHQSMGGFVIKYGTYTNPSPQPATWFNVGYYDANMNAWTSEMAQVNGAMIPEPGAAASLITGLLGCGLAIRRRLAR